MFHEGQRLGDFEILGRLGQGGMGAVYKARQVSLDRLVALKTLQGAFAADPEFIGRFRREAKAAAALNHPNLVQVYAAGENDGLHWFAMEYVEGESAKARLKRKGRLDPSAAVAIAIHTATALDYAWHKAQLIHRDIKPDNIFLSSDGEVKLGDLGLAKSVGEDQALTTTGAAMGTPHYVSPEQGEGRKDVDLRADIYSLGCTLFHFIAGETPFKGETAMGVMLQHVTSPVPELCAVRPDCPAELSRVVMKMMQKVPAGRQQSYEEVIADLRRAYDAFTSATMPAVFTDTKHARPAAARARPRRITITALAIGGIALLAAIAILLHFAPWKDGAAPKPSVSYAGTWKSVRNGNFGFVLKDDHTGIKMPKRGSGEQQIAGTWSVDKDGAFEFHALDGGRWLGKFSSDGQALTHPKSGDELRRESVSPAATPAPVPAKATVPNDPAKESSYVGMWKGGSDFEIKGDHTATRTKRSGERTAGTWTIDADGDFSVTWADSPNFKASTKFKAKLSKDGQTLNSTIGKGEASWTRVKP